MRVIVLLYLSVHCVFVCVRVRACMHVCMPMVLSSLCIFPMDDFTEALYEKKQTIMTYENETANFQVQVDDLEAVSAKKDTLIAKYKATLKESEGEINL